MFIEAKKLIGLPVAAEESQSKIGQISQIVIDPENGRILGFLVKTGGSASWRIFAPTLALSIVDIKEWDPNGLVTESVDNLVNPNEIIRLKDVLDKNIDFLKMSAKTEAGKSLGQIEDLLIDTDTETIAKYYLKDLLGKSRVLPAEKIIKVDKQIIFADDVGEPGGAVGATA